MKALAHKRRRDIGQQKWQFIAVVITVAMGVAMFAGTFNAYLNLGTSLEESYDRLHMADMVVTGAESGFVDSVQSVAGVSNAIERRQADVPFTIGDDNLLGRVIGFPGDGQPAINQVDVDEGDYLDPDTPTDVLLEKHAAANFDLAVGDTFTIAGNEVTVRGIVTSPEYLWPARDEQSLFTPPNTFAVAFALEQTLDDLGP
ncbi:MAG: cell division protein FtsX, partial [Acidimicrobiia bacterium]|nr:cell division protein FtsX [Acidimicrobiia bacterium]